MRVIVFLVVVVFLVFGASGVRDETHYRPPPKQTCGPLENFYANIQILFWQPVVDKFTFVMYTNSTPLAVAAQEKGAVWPIYRRAQPFDERCASIGVKDSLDVIVVNVKLVTGWLLPPILVSTPLNATIPALDICNKISSLAELPPEYVAPEVCKVATDLLRCSSYNVIWLLPWLLGLVLIFVGGLAFIGCVSIAVKGRN